jgi:TonB family protein
MTRRRTVPAPILLVVSWLLVCAPAVAVAQDALARARNLYESAEYEEALQVLASLKGSGAEGAAYQMFCLVALGRNGEASKAAEAIVRADPLYRPADGQVSPRIRVFFDNIRKPLLPELARQSYTKAKSAFDKKDWTVAVNEFTRAIAVLDEIDEPDSSVADLRTVAAGFRDLASASLKAEASATQPTPTPTPVPTPAATPPAAEPVVYTVEDSTVTKPVALSRSLPAWRPNAIDRRLMFSGTVELIISEEGRVLSAQIGKSIHPNYDSLLLEAARSWTFTPAARNGAPMRYRYLMEINLQ